MALVVILLLGEYMVCHMPNFEAGRQVTSQGAHTSVWTFLGQIHEQILSFLLAIPSPPSSQGDFLKKYAERVVALVTIYN